ncbi:MAG: asparagine synthase-related protein [Candidatus Peregrinibacteria bacterium]
MPLSPGICGIVRLDGGEIDREDFARMKGALSGHGECQEVHGTSYAIAQHGYNTTGHEGVCVEHDDSGVIAVEGRMDNRKDLIASLRSDGQSGYASLLRQGLDARGTDFCREISGPFAAAVLSTRSRTVQLFRDPLALRPLYYTVQSGRVLFGSDARQLLRVDGTRPAISEQKLLEVFSPMYLIDEGWSDPDSTMFTGIRSVPYGSRLEMGAEGVPHISRYWNPPERLGHGWQSPEECVEQFRALYTQVIAEHLDTPYGIAAELSGGIDSGCNVSIAGHLLAQQGKLIRTYTAVFDTQSPSERERVQSILHRYPDVSGNVVRCDERIGLLEQGPFHAFRTTAHPSRQNLPETFVELAQRAEQDGARVLLSGEGADWFLEGTDMIWDSLLKRGNIRECARVFSVLRQRSGFRRALRYILQSTGPMLLPGRMGRNAYLHAHYESTVNDGIPDLFTDAFYAQLMDMLRDQREQLARRKNLSCWSQTLEHELLFPPNHVWQGVPVGVEMRLPYLDRRVVEFGLTVPPEYKFHIHESNTSHYGCRKYLQREAFGHLVPPEVIRSQQKETYGSPVNQRLSRELPELLTHPMILCDIGVLERAKFANAVASFLSDADNDAHPLVPWLDSILVTEQWLRATTEEYPSCRLPTFHSSPS